MSTSSNVSEAVITALEVKAKRQNGVRYKEYKDWLTSLMLHVPL